MYTFAFYTTEHIRKHKCLEPLHFLLNLHALIHASCTYTYNLHLHLQPTPTFSLTHKHNYMPCHEMPIHNGYATPGLTCTGEQHSPLMVLCMGNGRITASSAALTIYDDFRLPYSCGAQGIGRTKQLIKLHNKHFSRLLKYGRGGTVHVSFM